jgi:VanZ family protein
MLRESKSNQSDKGRHPRRPGRSERNEPVDLTTPIWRKPLFFYYWAPPILWGVAILTMSGNWGSGKNTLNLLHWLLSWVATLEPAQLNIINHYVRKSGHILAYGLMFFLWWRAFRSHAGYRPWRACLWSLGMCLCFSSADEGRQSFYPTRGSSSWDVLLDMSGAALAALIIAVVWRSRSPAVSLPRIAEGKNPGPE